MIVDLPEIADRSVADLDQRFGRKAADLVGLVRDADEHGINVPHFRLVDRELLRTFFGRHGPPAGFVYDAVPRATDVPPEVLPLGRQFAAFLEDTGVFADRTGRATVLRSSLVRRPGVAALPGADITAFLPAWPGAPEVTGRVATHLYKAYTTLCLEHEAATTEQAREAGIVVMERVDWAVQGTAYATAADVVVELGRPDGYAEVCRSEADAIAAGLLSSEQAGRLFDCVRRLRMDVGPGAMTELEFVIDQGDAVRPVQRRPVPLGSSPAGTAVFHSAGTYQGPLVDLRGISRLASRQPAERIGVATDTAVLVPLVDADAHDAFSLAWLARDIQPAALVLSHGPGAHTGLEAHLRWTLRALFPRTLVVSVRKDRVPVRVRSCSVSSDGTAAQVTFA